MLNILYLALHLVVIIIVVREFKRYHDRKCQETYDVAYKFGKMVQNAINKYEEEK
jgi:hypothetical protein